MIYAITVAGHPVLRKKAEPIEKSYPQLDVLIKDMFETMEYSDGVGLAAPQIGKAIKLFVIDASPIADEETPELVDFQKVFINAKILEESGEEWLFNEGCLSVPGIREDVSRKSIIKIEYYDENWVKHTDTFDGIRARIIQHEYDHLQGILFTDKLSFLKKKMLKGKITDISKGKVDVSYKIRLR
ncbi:MAG: peptide deformylase [Salinivirgaceae bacterium]|nr:peptide deformylase [Salinivirgaceae bacterium]MDD4746817.1 peptide deformylase [Salinivirgaceae bacterium]MDY0278979.1 peptide deformylase [Salinivirgaceae bacterium]